MSRILVIFTGGTIASGFGGGGKAPAVAASGELRESLVRLFAERGVETKFCEPMGRPGIDSSEMDPGHWLMMSRCIASELERGLSGVLILHGTDTMANTAAWLSLCFGRLPIPIVLTGSQLTLDYMPEDVTSNLRGAAMACCSGLRGVWVYFNWKLIPGDRAHKAHAMHPDAFAAVNGQPLYFNPDWALEPAQVSGHFAGDSDLPPETARILEVEPDELRGRCARIRWFYAQPGTRPLWDENDRVICLLGYGAGNMIPSVLESMERSWPAAPRPCVIACSQAEGGVKNPSGYDRVGMARLARTGFSTWNQTDHSTEFVHSLCCYAMAAAPAAPESVIARHLRECR